MLCTLRARLRFILGIPCFILTQLLIFLQEVENGDETVDYGALLKKAGNPAVPIVDPPEVM